MSTVYLSMLYDDGQRKQFLGSVSLLNDCVMLIMHYLDGMSGDTVRSTRLAENIQNSRDGTIENASSSGPRTLTFAC